jgi:glycosyltransferase involved in cell wall biosynthesis
VGLFGELKPKKRVPFWLSALRDRGILQKISLLVVGRVDEETQAILSDLSLTPYVKQVPFVPSDDLPGYYAACDYLALPSMFEGLPNVLLEAMACGVVPVCSATGGMPDVLQDRETGFLFPPEDRAGAGDAMERALALNESELDAWRARVLGHVEEHFSVESEQDALVALLADLSLGASKSAGGQE